MSRLIEAVEALRVRRFSGEGWQSAPMLNRDDVLDLIRRHVIEDELTASKETVEAFERKRTKALDDLHGAYLFLLKKQKQAARRAAGKESEA